MSIASLENVIVMDNFVSIVNRQLKGTGGLYGRT